MMSHQRLLQWLGAWMCGLAMISAAGCAVPPQSADPSLSSYPVRADYFLAPVVRIHIQMFEGTSIPDEAVWGTVRTLERHLARPIEIVCHSPVVYPTDPDEFIAIAPFPVREDERLIGRAEVAAAHPEPYRLARPFEGLLGAKGNQLASGQWQVWPLLEPGTILVVILPGSEDGRGVTGHTATAAFEPDGRYHSGTAVLYQSPIRRRSNWFVSEAKLWEWTLTHEIGHILGVPANREHKWIVKGLGIHCTHPECVMYTGVDWRVVLSGLLHGWPLDFCEVCSEEMRKVREEEPRMNAD